MRRLRRVIMFCLMAALLAVSGSLIGPLHRAQVRYDLTNEPLEGASPAIVLATTALGAFRGILVDVIWIRMEDLKNDGKFFELVQLADLACKLEPRFPKVWDFNSWNLAYNVSVHIPRLEERWPWVKKGIELLRDQGIPNNPTVPQLYFLLGWLYVHKVGEDLDEAHAWYKQELALEMHEVLGGGGSVEELREFAGAPAIKQDLLEDEEVRRFYELCLAEGFDPLRENPDDGFLRFFSWVRRPEAIPEGARELMEGERFQDEVKKIAAFARARRLEKMHLDPRKMIALMERFGPLDWRGPHPHAIYWASEGLVVTQAYKRRLNEARVQRGLEAHDDDRWAKGMDYVYHDVNYDRVLYGALQNLVSRGRLLYDARGRILPMVGPDYRFADAMIELFEDVYDRYGDTTGPFWRGVRSAYENFLKNTSIEFFYMGDLNKSRRYYERLGQKYPWPKYKLPYEQFIREALDQYIGSLGSRRCRNVVRALIAQSYFYLGAGYDVRAQQLYEKARAVVRQWDMRQQADTLRQKVSFDEAREAALVDIFSGRAGFPLQVIERLKERLPGEVVRTLEESIKRREEEAGLKRFEAEEKHEEAED